MSRSDVELVRSAYSTLFGSDEWAEWIEAFIASEFELKDRTLPDVAHDLRGPEAAYAAAAHVRESFDWVRYDIEELRQPTDGRVLVRVRASGQGSASGMHIDGTLGHFWAVADAKVVRLDVYATWSDALEAVGLSR
jgi:SnoaL-like domain